MRFEGHACERLARQPSNVARGLRGRVDFSTTAFDAVNVVFASVNAVAMAIVVWTSTRHRQPSTPPGAALFAQTYRLPLKRVSRDD